MTEHKPIPWQVPDTSFVPLQVPQKRPAVQLKGYRVYSSSTDYTDVEAETVTQAIAKSGIAAPLKLQRLGLSTANILPEGALVQNAGDGEG